ncbi:MAG: glutamyl-tRNA reductase [Verrucomicrobiae bacterium]|nr:glutamyl-tRNA reductase [Verrucomicrobiae bacterium]
MPVYCVGLSHRTAPVEVRERFALEETAIPAALEGLRTGGIAAEAVWLSTCNRVEVYLEIETARVEEARRYLIEASRWDGEPPGEVLYVHSEPASIEHLFRVASGLDSMVLGETEILGQLKRAYELARRHGHTGARLNRAFQRAFNVAKQIRSETQIQRGGISVASVAVELTERIFETVEGRQVLVVGAGDTGEKVARALLSRGVAQVWIANRTVERAEALAGVLGERTRAIADWEEAAPDADVWISSTSSPGYVLDVGRVEALMVARGRRPLLLVDLAVPRDIDPGVIGISDVYLFNVDDLEAIAKAHLRQREAEVARCEALIRERASGLLTAVVSARGAAASGAMSAPA